MGNYLTHTVSGNSVFFKSADIMPIDSLKINFLPILEGSGDPSPSNVRSITGWTGINTYHSALPKEYLEVEYLENSGTQYIISDYTPSSMNTKVEWKYMITVSQGNTVMFGCSTGSTTNDYAYQVELYNNLAWYNGCGSAFYSNALSSPVRGGELNTMYNATMDTNIFSVDGYLVEPNKTRLKPEIYPTMYIYAYNNINSDKRYINAGIRLYYLRFYENNILVANFIPCIRKSDNEPGMFNTITLTFLTNAGIGTFTYGLIVEQSISITFPGVGKNLIDQSLLINSSTITLENGFYKGKRMDYFMNFNLTGNIFYKENTQYTVSLIGKNEDSNGSSSIGIYYTDGTQSFASWSGVEETTISLTSAGGKTIDYVFFYFTGNYNKYTYIKNLLIEEGTSATTYEPFDNIVYGGYVNLITGELILTHKKVILNDGSKWQSGYWDSTNTIPIFTYIDSTFNDRKTGSSTIYYCSYCCSIGDAAGADDTQPIVRWSGKNYFDVILSPKDTGLTLEDVKTLSNNNQIAICYELETPIIHLLSPIQLKTLLGLNIIWTNTNSTTEVVYQFQDHLLPLRMLIKLPHIETVSGNIANFNTNMSAHLKECKIYFNPIQMGSGAPSPNNIRSINGWTELKLFTSPTSINLSPANFSSYENNGAVFRSLGENIFELEGTITEGFTVDIPVSFTFQADTQYNIMIIRSKNHLMLSGFTEIGILFKSDGKNALLIRPNGAWNNDIFSSSWTPTITSNVDTLRIGMVTGNGNFKMQIIISEANITTINSIFNNTIYGGYIDLINGKIISEWGYDDLGNYDWWEGNSTGLALIKSVPTNVKWWNSEYIADETPNLLIDSIKVLSRDDFVNLALSKTEDIAMVNYRNVPYIASPNLVNVTDSQVKAYVTGKKFLYKFNTPIEYPLTLQILKTLRGTNNIWSNANGPVSITYWTH